MSGGKDSDLKLSKEEVDRFKAAFENEEFRKMFADYAKEISDPENRRQYEEEITRMETERGADVKFIHPKSGFVIKLAYEGTKEKLFINVCSSDVVDDATSSKAEASSDGSRRPGQHWSIPYSLTPIKQDLDKAHKKCDVCDAVFHPNTYERGQKDQRFRQLLIDTAIDGVEQQFKKKINRKSLKVLKMSYKGMPTPTVIRQAPKDLDDKSKDDKDDPVKFPNPYAMMDAAKEKQEKRAQQVEESKKNKQDPTVPTYRIVQRKNFNIQDFRDSRDSTPGTRPNELVVTIDLPLLDSAAGLDLDVFDKQLTLKCESPNYHLDITLPYPVDFDNGNAKFDKSKKHLKVTLPVVLTDESIIPQVEEISEDISAAGNESICPPYKFSQTEDEVIFIIRVRDVDVATVKSRFSEQEFSIEFLGTKANNMNEREIENFALYVKFVEDAITVNACNVSVEPHNVVVKLAKGDQHRCLWSKFYAGVSLDETEEMLFALPDNIEKVIEEKEESIRADNQDCSIEVEVEEKNAEQLVVRVDVDPKEKLDDVNNKKESEDKALNLSDAIREPETQNENCIDESANTEQTVSPEEHTQIRMDIPESAINNNHEGQGDNDIPTSQSNDTQKDIKLGSNLDSSQVKISARITKDLTSKFKNNLLFDLDD